MRISDAMMAANYLNNLSKSREKLNAIQAQMSSQKKIQKPSDSPDGTARVMDFQVKMNQSEIYQKNIDNSVSFIKESINSLGQIDSSITDVLKAITDSRNSNLSNSNLEGISDKIDAVLTSIMDSANGKYDGKYLFAGTDYSTAPYGFTTDKSAVEVKSSDIQGSTSVRISENRIQNINLPGSDVFATVVSQTGNMDFSAAVGSTSTSSTQVYDASGNAYTLNVSYQKTAASTYSMTYDVLDSSNTSVLPSTPAAKVFAFDSGTGLLKTIDGDAPKGTSIKIPGSKIEFLLDSTQLTEQNSAAAVSNSANQKTNIFNTLIAIRDGLKSGTTPTAAQENAVKSFYDNLLNKESQMGNVLNQMENVQDLLKQKTTNFQELISNEMEVDMPKLLIDLQSQQYVLEMSYKMASMILPKSLMDYL